jgi:hypothetical protein
MNNSIKHLPNGDFEVVPLDDPAFLEAQKKREEALDKLAELGQELQKAQEEYERKNDEWWNNLSYDERCDAFYAVCKRLTEGELEKKGSYRFVLYDVFGFGPDMYIQGMNCGYMALHNSIVDNEL